MEPRPQESFSASRWLLAAALVLLAGLLMALTYIGGELASFMLGLPSAAIQAFQGMLLFFLLAVDLLTNFRIRFGTRKEAH